MISLKYLFIERRLKEALSKLPEKVSESVRKKGIRKGANPFVKDLRKLWRSAKYKGRRPHRRAIGHAIVLDGPKRAGKGPSAPLRFSIGVDYASKRAQKKQRIYHLLESGFRHVGSKSKIRGAKRSLKWSRSNQKKLARSIQEQILIAAREALP